MTSPPTTSDKMTWSGHFESPQLIIPPIFAPRSSPMYLIIYIFYLDNKKQRVPNRNNMYQTKLNGHLSSSTRFLTTPQAHRDNRDSCRESLSAGNKGDPRAPLHMNSVQV